MQYEDLMQLPHAKFLAEVLRDHPDGSWHNTQKWLMGKYTPEQIAAMYAKLYVQLVEYTPDGEEEDSRAELLRDQMDIFWYATTLELVDKELDKQGVISNL
jgi:hypothetical protein